ncbi:MAG: NnrU family protein [Gammaproteobacteria bacterium]|nr:NnrU family protein [Gammaproteobacteria bacterium]
MNASTPALVLLLIPGLLLFMGLHLMREFGLRERLQTRLGTGPYRLLFSVAILISLVLIVQGKAGAPFIQLWVPPFNLRSLTHLIMISATMLFIVGSLPHSFTRELVIHPMLIGVILWGVAHVISNGDLASVLLFGVLPLWAIVKIVSLERVRQRTKMAAGQPVSPPALRPALQWDAAAIVLGVIAYAVFLVFHGQMFGLALIAPV